MIGFMYKFNCDSFFKESELKEVFSSLIKDESFKRNFFFESEGAFSL